MGLLGPHTTQAPGEISRSGPLTGPGRVGFFLFSNSTPSQGPTPAMPKIGPRGVLVVKNGSCPGNECGRNKIHPLGLCNGGALENQTRPAPPQRPVLSGRIRWASGFMGRCLLSWGVGTGVFQFRGRYTKESPLARCCEQSCALQSDNKGKEAGSQAAAGL